MDNDTTTRGIMYEELMQRAYGQKIWEANIYDRRMYYLLYYIKRGADLRNTGYTQHFLTIRGNVYAAINEMLKSELHHHEKLGLQKLLDNMQRAWSEDSLEYILTTALRVTERLKIPE